MKYWFLTFWFFVGLPSFATAEGQSMTIQQTVVLHQVVTVAGTTVGIASYPGILYTREQGDSLWHEERFLSFKSIGIDALEAVPERNMIRFIGHRVENERPVWVRWTFPTTTPFRETVISDTLPDDFKPFQFRFDRMMRQIKPPGLQRDR